MALGLQVPLRFFVPRGTRKCPLRERETDEINNEQYQGTVGSNDHHRKHRPERVQEQVEEPAHARREHANNGKEADDAENERSEQDTLGKREVGDL
jgi:hypothetical protein